MPWAVSTSNAVFAAAATTSFRGLTVLMPSIRPSPATLSTPGAPSSSRLMYSLLALTSASSASSMRESMFSAPAQTAGLPPKVEPCVPAVRVCSVFSPNRHAPIGSRRRGL